MAQSVHQYYTISFNYMYSKIVKTAEKIISGHLSGFREDDQSSIFRKTGFWKINGIYKEKLNELDIIYFQKAYNNIHGIGIKYPCRIHPVFK